MRHALAHLTGLPVPRPDHPARPLSLVAFPLVGLLIGLVWIVTARITGVLLGPAVAAGAILLVDAWLTRALHLDGIASVVDGMAGGDEPEDSIALVREAAVAVPGVAAMLMMSIVRFAIFVLAASPTGRLLGGLIPITAFALLAVPVAGRLAMVLCYALVPPRDDETATFGEPSGAIVLAAGVIAAAIVIPAAGVAGIAALGVGLGVAFMISWWWRQRFGGLVAELPAGVAIVAETLALVVVYSG